MQRYGYKGSKAGMPVENYKIPSHEPTDDGYDWYCFECHLAGDVTLCKCCHRVFHDQCNVVAAQKLKLKNERLQVIKPNLSKTEIESIIQGTHIQHPFIYSNQEGNQINSGLQTNSNPDQINMSKTDDSISTIDLSKDDSGFLTENNRDTNTSDVHNQYDENLCSICNHANREEELDLSKQEFNHLLQYIHDRIKSWLPQSITDVLAPDSQPEWMTSTERTWRAQQLFYKHMDMPMIELKLRMQDYSKICEFYSDVMTVHHNVAVYHGVQSQEYGAAELMLRDTLYDISELKNCPECYRHSNEKIHSKWFCLPCRKPHKLVWAKQKGYPYWPAKVLREKGGNCDVRFFGGKYERSVLPATNVKPITVDMDTLQVKKSAAFNKALEELKLHQALLDNPNDLSKLMTPKNKRSVFKPRNSLPSRKSTKAEVKKSKVIEKNEDYDFNQSPTDKTKMYTSTPRRGIKRKNSVSDSPKGFSPKPDLTAQTNANSYNYDKIMKANETKPMNNNTSSITINTSSESDEDFSILTDDYQPRLSCGHSEVSSSTEHNKKERNELARHNELSHIAERSNKTKAAILKFQSTLEACEDKEQMAKIAIDCMTEEIAQIHNDHDDYIKKMFEVHNAQISETKKKQWCYNCEQDAIYHCCWNTAYCSPSCQQQHWQAEHKKVCRRKR